MICNDCGSVILTAEEFSKIITHSAIGGAFIIMLVYVVSSGIMCLVVYFKRKKQPMLSDEQIIGLYRMWDRERIKRL